MVTIKDLLESYKDDLMEPLMVLSKLMEVDKSYIYTHIDLGLAREVVDKFEAIMAKRKEGYPIQYLLKEREFMGLNLFVEEGVLIPRNDTEILVEYIIGYAKDRPVNILEIGTGSGAISVSLGYYLKKAKILGVDISKKALDVTRKNIDRFKLDNVSVIESDIFENVEDRFNIIVSNPPYIRTDVIGSLDVEVKDYEPSLALDGGLDGLYFYREITKNSKDYLEDQGLLALEIGYDQGEELLELMTEEGFKNIDIIKDLQGHNRLIIGNYERR